MSTTEEKYQSALLRVSAHDRLYGSTNDFVVNLPPSYAQFRSVVGVQVMQVHIPNTFYNVSEGKNILIWQKPNDNQGWRTHVGPTGFLSVQDIIDDIEAGTSIRFRTDDLEKKFFLEVKKQNATPDLQVDCTSPLAQILGFYEGTQAIRNFDNTWRFLPSTLSLAGVDVIYISCPELGDSFIDTQNGGTMSPIIAAVPNTSVAGGANHFIPTFSSPTWYNNQFRHLSTLHFRLEDSHGDILDNNGVDWTIVLKIFYENRI